MNVVKKGEEIYKSRPEDPEKESKVVIIDCDSMVYECAHPGKDDWGNLLPDYEEDEYIIAEGKLTERILGVLNKIEEKYNIIDHHLCIKGSSNFRYNIYPDYKANRKDREIPPVLDHLFQYLEDNFKAIRSHGYEADDMVYTLSESIDHQGIIVYIDKDLLQIPSLFYNFRTEEWRIMDSVEAKHSLAMQMLTGDASDGINFLKGIGPAKASKIIYMGMSDYQYIKAIYLTFKKYWGDEAKRMTKLSYDLLRMHKIPDEKLVLQAE